MTPGCVAATHVAVFFTMLYACLPSVSVRVSAGASVSVSVGVSVRVRVRVRAPRTPAQFKNECLAEMWSGSEEGS